MQPNRLCPRCKLKVFKSNLKSISLNEIPKTIKVCFEYLYFKTMDTIVLDPYWNYINGVDI